MATNTEKLNKLIFKVNKIETHLEALLKKFDGDFTRPTGKGSVGSKPKPKKKSASNKFVCSCKTDSDGIPTNIFSETGIESHKSWCGPKRNHTICKESVWNSKPRKERLKLKAEGEAKK